MSYAAALGDLTGAAAALLAAGPLTDRDLRGAEADRVLASRDTVVGELRALTGEILGARHAAEDRLRPRHVLSDPGHVLHDALRGLGRAAPTTASPNEALAAGEDAWAVAARAAVAFEAYHQAARELPGPAAWAALRDLADLAAAVPHLDADLAGRLAEDTGPARRLLTDPVTHGLVWLCADTLRGQLPEPGDTGHLAVLDREPARSLILRSTADLPAGMRRLAAVLGDVGPQLAAVDARAVARVLAGGLDAVHRRLPDRAAPDPQLATALRDALPGLHRVRTEPLATLSLPDPRLRLLTTELHRHTRALVDPHTSPATALGWAREAPAAAAALAAAVEGMADTGRLLTSRSEEAVVAAAGWRKISPATAGQHPVVAGLRHTRDVLARAAPALASAAETAGAAPRRDRAVAAAAAAAGRAGTQLRAALAGRSPHQLLPGELPPHPSQRRPVTANQPRTGRP